MKDLVRDLKVGIVLDLIVGIAQGLRAEIVEGYSHIQLLLKRFWMATPIRICMISTLSSKCTRHITLAFRHLKLKVLVNSRRLILQRRTKTSKACNP